MSASFSCLSSILELLEANLEHLEQDDLNRLQDQCDSAASTIFHMNAIIGQLLMERKNLNPIDYLVDESTLTAFTGEWLAIVGELCAQMQSMSDTAETVLKNYQCISQNGGVKK